MSSPDSPLLLDDPGRWVAAVEDAEGPQLVLAGPGTGKTEFLARRVVHLIEGGAATEAIAILTFSRRAASEFEHRISDKLKRPRSGATASTFHSFAHRIVEAHRSATRQEMPTLLTGPEQVRFVSQLLDQEDRRQWPAGFRAILATTTFAAEVADFVMRCGERLIGPDSLASLAENRDDWRALPGFLATYLDALADQGKVDYAGLLAEAVAIAESVAIAKEGAANGPDLIDQFQYVVVDEYQDTSPAQVRLAEAVAQRTANITVAADPHQSIYSFRGADLDNVEGFADRVAARTGRSPKVIVLTRSLRVPPAILTSARRLVAPNPPGRLPDVEISPAGHQGAVEAYTFDQRSGEAEWIAAEVERLHVAESVPLRSMAVVVRSTRHLLPELSRTLDRRRIPHDRADARLVDHPAIRLVHDVVVASTAGPAEADRAVNRLLLGPLLALPLGRQRELVRFRQRGRSDWPEVIRSQLPESAALAVLIDDPTWATVPAAVDGFWHLWDALPHVERLVADPARADYRAAWSAFARMLERQAERDPSISLADSLEATLSGDFEASPLLSFTRPEEDQLVVTTLHQVKGLEFDVVFIADAIEGVFPDTRRWRALLQPDLLAGPLDGPTRAQARLSEERRLAYTATTRARRRVVWTATTAGIDESERRPSRFILTATGAESFDQIRPPQPSPETEFAPLTMTDAQARLRRSLADPAAGTVDRLAALAVLSAENRHWEARFFAAVPEPGPDTGVIGEQIHLSPSQASLYEQCPRRYVLERRLGAVNVDSPYLRFGSIVHEILEEAEKEAMAQGLQHATLEMALGHLSTVWNKEARFGTAPTNEAWRRRAQALLARIYSDWPGGSDEPVALELELTATIGGVDWVGRADRIDRSGEGLKIVDYKTSKSGPTLKEAGASLQLGYYLLAAAHHPDLTGTPVAAELWYPLAEGRRVFPFEMKELGQVEVTLAEVAAGITAEDWTPRVGRHCDRCAFRLVCPAWPDGSEGTP